MADADTRKRLLAAGALLAGTGVALGAFAAPGLKARLGAAELGWWETAVQYQMWHGLALVALAGTRLPGAGLAAALLGSGAILFSASLYLMTLTGLRLLGAVAPVGGTLMILGWALLAWKAVRAPR